MHHVNKGHRTLKHYSSLTGLDIALRGLKSGPVPSPAWVDDQRLFPGLTTTRPLVLINGNETNRKRVVCTGVRACGPEVVWTSPF